MRNSTFQILIISLIINCKEWFYKKKSFQIFLFISLTKITPIIKDAAWRQRDKKIVSEKEIMFFLSFQWTLWTNDIVNKNTCCIFCQGSLGSIHKGTNVLKPLIFIMMSYQIMQCTRKALYHEKAYFSHGYLHGTISLKGFILISMSCIKLCFMKTTIECCADEQTPSKWTGRRVERIFVSFL